MYTVLFSNICEPKRNYGSYVQQLLFAAQLDLWKQRQSKKKKRKKQQQKTLSIQSTKIRPFTHSSFSKGEARTETLDKI